MGGDPINPKAPVVSNIAVCAVAISKDVAENLDVDVTPRTIRRRLREKGLKSCKACKKPFVSRRNRALRLRWAEEHVHWTTQRWEKVLWSDERPFLLRWTGNVRVWKKAGERYHRDCLVGTVKHQPKIMVWACFCARGNA